MLLDADEVRNLPGRQLIASLREVLVEEDARIRATQDMLVETGMRRRPDASQLSVADRLHAIDRMLQHAAHRGEKVTVKELVQVARDAWAHQLVGRDVDAAGDEAEAATEQGDSEQPAPEPVARGRKRG